MNWERVLSIHTQAAASLAETAERIAADRWLEPRAEGKWTPGHVLEHLNLTYETVLGDLGGRGGMAVLTKWWQRALLRVFVVPRILRGGWFPGGARAPRELRPAQAATDQRAAIARFRELAQRFGDDVIAAREKGGATIAHAYFGRAGLDRSVLLCARHIEHHQRQLEAMLGSSE
jgi:hypothetical protein